MRKQKARILVVEDERPSLWAVRANLEARGYEVITAPDGRTAVRLAADHEPELMILDIRLPDVSGYDVCRQVREFSAMPIIMLTALGEEADKVQGLDAGADDYVTKPFSIEELLARVRAGLRRSALLAGEMREPVFRAGDLVVDLEQQRVFVGGEEVSLTPTEYHLLSELVRNVGRVLSHEYLLEKVWGTQWGQDTGLLQQAVHRLRHKIERAIDSPVYIQTRRGMGYVFVPPEGEVQAQG